MVKLYVVHVNSYCNVILNRTTLPALKEITSIPHLKMKFPINFGIREVIEVQDVLKVLPPNS